ncbi:MAG: hypothetical protein COA67_04570 [Lutibacter sp.]|nr:MAG: hypothetical protein COA67_04570 [Lutibacter sp.]
MKTVLNIILGSVVLFSFAQCGNSKEMVYKLQDDSPFIISNATFKEWVAGVAGGGSGVNVFISFTDLDTDKIVIDSVFFRGQVSKVEKKPTAYVARFKTNVNKPLDLIMHSETDQEYGNKAPIKETKFPFEIEDDEAIICYKEKGKLKYFKQKLLREEPDLYP